jgi:superfamily II DNA or RNA helicase
VCSLIVSEHTSPNKQEKLLCEQNWKFGMKLHKYQEDAIRKALTGLRNDRGRVQVVSLPTGAGKTLVALKIVLRFLNDHSDGQVLWLAHTWELLKQTAETLEKNHPSLAEQVSRIGGKNTPLGELQESSLTRIFFTTLQTWHKRSQAGKSPPLLNHKPLLLVVDECHWAAEAPLGQSLLNQFLGRASILGLSATPIVNRAKYSVVARQSFADLCPQYLAKPLVHEVATGILWDPIIRFGEIIPASLSELATSRKRNARIIRTYIEGHAAGHFTRTLIFACDIPHANLLNQSLSQRGAASRAVHSQRNPEDNRSAIEDFRRGRVAVLVTVGMLTEGFDLPEIDSVFLARPTASLTLLAQMIGRGARKAPLKDSFRVVEFNDSVARLGAHLFHARDYVSSPTGQRSRFLNGAAERHDEPDDLPQFERLELPGLESVTFARDQTFGVEVELSSNEGIPEFEEPQWKQVAREIIFRLQETAQLPVHNEPLHYHENDDATKWRVCFDRSSGWEVVSPILVNAEGFAELARITEGLSSLVKDSPILRVNVDTGLHITLATRLDTESRLRGFVSRLTRLEAGLYTLVAPSRLYEWVNRNLYIRRRRNQYCMPVCEATGLRRNMSFSHLAEVAGRYRSVNLTKLFGQTRLLEVRLHHGTTEARKILPWICLWMHIFNHARYSWRGEPSFGRVMPKGDTAISLNQADREDIFRLLRQEGISLPNEFERLLRERRKELRPYWARAVPKRVAIWAEAAWYDVMSSTDVQLSLNE